MTSTALNRLTQEHIQHCLQQTSYIEEPTPAFIKEQATRQAAVLMPLVHHNQQWHLLFIKRSESEKDHHSGQVAFPGGRYEPEDHSLQWTALRESHEEIGLQEGDVRLLGQLNQHYSYSGYRITPFIGQIPWPYSLRLQHEEVELTFIMPLDWLANTNHYQLRQRRLPESHHSIPVIHYQAYQGHILWGATARMVLTFIELLQEPY